MTQKRLEFATYRAALILLLSCCLAGLAGAQTPIANGSITSGEPGLLPPGVSIIEGTNKKISPAVQKLAKQSKVSTLKAIKDVEISGTVSDETGQPLAGVTILIKDTGTGTISDIDGKYQLNTPENAVLVFSYIGYVTLEVPLAGKTIVDITLQVDVEQLEEVVVIGYGTQSRGLVTSAISKIDQAEVNNTPAAHPVQALQGKVAGVSVNVDSGQPGSGAAVYIRGGTQPDPRGIANEPLYIIDGIFREDLIGINPSDIESIEVLKDAAASAIYGARAANGVVLVTTKTGKGVQGSRVTVQYAQGIDIAETYTYSSAAEYLDISRRAAERGINLGAPARLEDTKFGYSIQNVTNQGEFGFERVAVAFLDDLTAIEGQAYIDNLLNSGYETMVDPVTGRTLIFLDNQLNDIRYRDATVRNLNLSMTGGNESGNYNISLGYLDQEGTLKGTGAKRFNALINGDFKAFDNFTIHSGFSYEFSDIDQPRSTNNTINRSSRLPHTYRIWNDDGTPALGESTGSPRNLEHELFYRDDIRQNYRTSFRLGFDWEIIEGLSIRPTASIYRREAIVNFFERASREVTARNMFRSQNTDNQVQLDGLLNYTRTFGQSHNITALLGTQFVREISEDFSGSGANAPTDLISTLGASETERERTFSAYGENRLFSVFGRINYDYGGKYILGFSLRRDGSSRFADNNRFGLFSAVSAGWNVHRESFWKSNLINKLKIRASWGQAGNDNLSLSDTRGSFNTTSYALNGGVRTGALPNFDLVWETTTTTDIGFDIGFLNNRFNILVDLYNKVTSDRLIAKPLPSQTGFGSIRSNLGSLRNRGLELEIDANILNKGNFRWNLAMNWAFNQSRIIDLPENERDKNRVSGGEVWDENGNLVEVGGLAEGERPFGLWAFDLIGVYSTQAEAAESPDDELVSGFYRNLYGATKNAGDAIWRDVNNDNIIDHRDVVFVGYRDPDKRGGLVNTFSFKGFTLRVAADWAMGHMISNGWRARSNGNARNNVMTLPEAGGSQIWQQEGDNASIPRYDNASDFDNGARNHSRFLVTTANRDISLGTGNASDNTLYYKKGDFLAFREISLSYSLPSSILNKIGMAASSIGLELYNLGYITDYDGLTPEHYDGVDEGIYSRPFQARIRLTGTF